MKTLSIAGLLALLALGAPAGPDARAGLLAADASWNELRLKPDVPGLERLLAEDWLLTHSDGRVQTRAEYLDELRTRARSNQAIANDDVRVRLYGDTGLVTGISVQSGTSDGQPWSGRFRFTRVWIRRGGAWLMVSSHSSRIAGAP